jgi:hypothetical protein
VQGAHSVPLFRPIVRATGGLVVLGIIVAAYAIHAAMGREAAFSWIRGATVSLSASELAKLSASHSRLIAKLGNQPRSKREPKESP